MTRLAALLLAVVVSCALVWAGVRAASAWQYFAAESIAGRLVFDGEFPDEELNAASQRIESAMSLWPSHPDFLTLHGYLLELKAMRAGIGPGEKRDLLQLAAADYRAALATRPLWPYSWSDLLQAKEKLNEIDGEFLLALHRASETGPWEPKVQLELVHTGLRRWDQLNSGNRALVSEAISRSLKVQPRQSFELIRLYARPDLLCPLNVPEPQIEQWCSVVF